MEASYSVVSTNGLSFDHLTVKTRVNAPALPQMPGKPAWEEHYSIEQSDRFFFKRLGMVALHADLHPNETILTTTNKHHQAPKRPHESPLMSIISTLWSDKPFDDSQSLAFEILNSYPASAGRMDESLEQFNKLFQLEAQATNRRFIWDAIEVPDSLTKIRPETLPPGTAATFQLAFLKRVAPVLGYESASVRFDIERLNPEPDRHLTKLRNLRFFFKRGDEEVSHDLLSYGQKRLLAFFANADASGDIIIADELVNGLHHEWISACLNEIGERQAILTSQNPLLLDFLRFESIEEVRNTFIICKRAESATDAQLIWRNLTEDEAESFFLAYQTGIQRVSDILLTKGLW
ncbi:ATP-binding protein [Corallococcus sp. NCSPR001]|uniref:AAA family ATPase n=1 Tax=Corallococcus sp. NCSPR001 TaxID=2813576 RepID=UPI001A8F6DF0|nr:AAA family ATPase [Corallococcus sp. NCSPR001]MBN9681142.1 ATP-binding protein [Corallococcus sp. NCSPR001]